MSTTPGPKGASSSVDYSGGYSTEPWPLSSSFSNPVRNSLSDDPWVRALFTISQRAAKKRSRRLKRTYAVPGASVSQRTGEPNARTAVPSPYSLAEAAPQLANPLAPLRDRDRQALGDMFAHDQMAAIEADILNRLSHLVPEPIWAVEPYEFLQEFL